MLNKNRIRINIIFKIPVPNLLFTNSVRDIPLGNSFLIFGPKFNKNNIGAAVPSAYPTIAPIPPQVAAEAGPNNIQAPKADADKLVVSEKILSFLSPIIVVFII